MIFITWRARVSSSKSCCWTLRGSLRNSSGSLSSPSPDLEVSVESFLVIRLSFLRGVALLIASWKRTALSWSNCAVTECSFSLKIRTYKSKLALAFKKQIAPPFMNVLSFSISKDSMHIKYFCNVYSSYCIVAITYSFR